MIRTETTQSFGAAAADFVCPRLSDDAAIALPTGATPRPLYAELARRAGLGLGRLGRAHFYNLDEYCGLAREHPRSFAAFLENAFIVPAGLDPARVHLIDGAARDREAECERYEGSLAEHGGIGLCLLGVGENGHVAFNEPGTPWNRRTHVAALSRSTRQRLEAQGWEQGSIPTHGITLGIDNILEAREVLLLVAGPGKQAALAALYRGVEDIAWPVTCLLRHRQVTVIELCAPGALP